MKSQACLAVLAMLITACGGADRYEATLSAVSPKPAGPAEDGIIYFSPPASGQVEIESGFFYTPETVVEVLMKGPSREGASDDGTVASITFVKNGSDATVSYSVQGSYPLSGKQEDVFESGEMSIVVRTEESPEGNLRGPIVPVDIPFSLGY
ncbi:hypothetical protein [Hyalangium versicolor]|uniref:hypothetical protein n=1 Tax=Hyalangium versicolor TaxID=2861190 RepID=UPI001CCB9B0F|nr:hypothetical protein [Hyalangium versicolor]